MLANDSFLPNTHCIRINSVLTWTKSGWWSSLAECMGWQWHAGASKFAQTSCRSRKTLSQPCCWTSQIHTRVFWIMRRLPNAYTLTYLTTYVCTLCTQQILRGFDALFLWPTPKRDKILIKTKISLFCWSNQTKITSYVYHLIIQNFNPIILLGF